MTRSTNRAAWPTPARRSRSRESSPISSGTWPAATVCPFKRLREPRPRRGREDDALSAGGFVVPQPLGALRAAFAARGCLRRVLGQACRRRVVEAGGRRVADVALPRRAVAQELGDGGRVARAPVGRAFALGPWGSD